MGKSTVMKYRVEIHGENGKKGVFGWEVGLYGKANIKNLAKFVAKITPKVHEAKIIEQKTGTIVATFELEG
jgi:hypothetical protein